MTASLIKASEKDKKAIKLMAQNLNLLTSVTIKVIQTANTWQNKKVKKTGLCVNLFVKAAKLILKDKSANNEEVIKEGARLVTALQVAIEAD
jgi:hypothetical protein